MNGAAPRLRATRTLPTCPTSSWERAQTPPGGPGKGPRVQAFIIPVPPREDPTERTDQDPSLGKRRFRDDGQVKHSTSPAGRGALGGTAQSRGSRRVRATPHPGRGQFCQALHMDSEVRREAEERQGEGVGRQGSLPLHPTQPSHSCPHRGSHHPRGKCARGGFDLRT